MTRNAISLLTIVAAWTILPLSGLSWATEMPRSVPRWEAQTQTSGYRIVIMPRTASIPIGQHHDWLIDLRHANGAPVTDAQFRIAGAMPGHGHGMPSQPVVTGQPEAGRYLVKGMQFNMHGRWVLLVAIRTGNGADRAQIAIDVRH